MPGVGGEGVARNATRRPLDVDQLGVGAQRLARRKARLAGVEDGRDGLHCSVRGRGYLAQRLDQPLDFRVHSAPRADDRHDRRVGEDLKVDALRVVQE